MTKVSSDSSSSKDCAFYVSLLGKDSWSGRLPEPNAEGSDGPFANLLRARDAVRTLKAKAQLDRPVAIWVRGGKYYLEDTFWLDCEDSGTCECPVTYAAYPGEKPILSG